MTTQPVYLNLTRAGVKNLTNNIAVLGHSRFNTVGLFGLGKSMPASSEDVQPITKAISETTAQTRSEFQSRAAVKSYFEVNGNNENQCFCQQGQSQDRCFCQWP